MRRFKFIGDQNLPWILPVEKYCIYDIDYFCKEGGDLIEPSHEWIEVFENQFEPEGFLDRMHKDTDLGYYAGLAMQALLSNPKTATQITEQFGINVTADKSNELVAKTSIGIAKKLIKQLDKETK